MYNFNTTYNFTGEDMNECDKEYYLIHSNKMKDSGELVELYIQESIYDFEPIPETANEVTYKWECKTDDGLSITCFNGDYAKYWLIYPCNMFIVSFKEERENMLLYRKHDGINESEILLMRNRFDALLTKIDAYAKDVLENEILPDVKNKTLEKYINQTQQNGQPQIFHQNEN